MFKYFGRVIVSITNEVDTQNIGLKKSNRKFRCN